MFRVLVVEDDRDLCELFCTVLHENGYQALHAFNGDGALALLEHEYVDLVISDVMMPGMDGYTLTRLLRQSDEALPILIITAKDQLRDKRQGFQAGVDDYMVKPVDVNEMLLRVAALLRRSRSIHERRLQLGQTVLECDALAVRCGGRETILPQKEFYLLYKLLFSVGKIFTRRQLIDEIWGVDFEGDPHTLEVHVSRLREKFRQNADFEIVTVRGLGYKAVKRNEASV